MNPTLPEGVAEFGATADKAVAAAGGTDLARRAEADPSIRAGAIRRLLDGLGLAELDPRADAGSAAAAAELCRVAGRYALPYPVAGVLLGGDEPVCLGGAGDPRVDHGDLFPRWRLVRIDGPPIRVVPDGSPLGSRLGAFVTPMRTSGQTQVHELDAALALTFASWRILGAAERAVELAVGHIRDRQQFGQALAKFQAVQFQVADAAVAVDGLRELSRWTLWRVLSDPGSRRVDPLALRLHAIDSGRQVLRTCQQLFGASGLCDEYDISMLVRFSQPEMRLPWGAEATAALLFTAVAEDGFESLFRQGGGG
jgi:hypothetical protein